MIRYIKMVFISFQLILPSFIVRADKLQQYNSINYILCVFWVFQDTVLAFFCSEIPSNDRIICFSQLFLNLDYLLSFITLAC